MTVPLRPASGITLALFCKVVDNFGDIGLCWRLARQLTLEQGVTVTLWVDDLASFRRIAPAIDIALPMQEIEHVIVRRWDAAPVAVVAADIADIVIEFFGCDIPETYIAAMAQCKTPPVWLNLEGLTAETWVEGCHGLPSPHPRLPLTKWFFFPGFNARTGGLLRERELLAEARVFQADAAARAVFLQNLGLTPAEQAAWKVSLFCYPHAPVAALFDALARGQRAVTCLVPEGVAGTDVEAFLQADAAVGAVRTVGSLTVRVLPFVPQADYDRLLWACDVNIVRGEDSFVRAQWAGKPCLWHIYPQDKNLHHVKLQAFLDCYAAGPEATQAMQWWNGMGNDAVSTAGGQMQASLIWNAFVAAQTTIARRAREWRDALAAQDDLATELVQFAASRKAGGA